MKSFDIPTTSMSAVSLLGSSFDYEGLFAASAEPVLIIDALTERICEANPSALRLLGAAGAGVRAVELATWFPPEGVATLRAGMNTAHVQQRAALIGVRARHHPAELDAKISMFRTASQAYFLVRLTPNSRAKPLAMRGFPRSAAFTAIDGASFGFVVTDAAFRIDYVNHTFAAMTGKRSKAELAGSSLERWLILSPSARSDLQNQLLRRIALTHFITTLPGHPTSHVAIEAICVPAGPDSSWAFVVNQTSAPH